MTKDTGDIYAALFAVQTSVDVVRKTTNNPFFKSKYADLPAVWDVVKDALKDNNILVYHKTVTQEGVDYLNTYIRHIPSGTEITSNVQLHLQKPTSQEYGSCVTYMRRYAISSMLGLITDKDDDGNDASQTAPKAKVESKAKQEPKPFTGEEFLSLQKEIKEATAETLPTVKDKSRAAWGRMSKEQQAVIRKSITDADAKLDDIPDYTNVIMAG